MSNMTYRSPRDPIRTLDKLVSQKAGVKTGSRYYEYGGRSGDHEGTGPQADQAEEFLKEMGEFNNCRSGMKGPHK
jgi:hypothetical protein